MPLEKLIVTILVFSNLSVQILDVIAFLINQLLSVCRVITELSGLVGVNIFRLLRRESLGSIGQSFLTNLFLSLLLVKNILNFDALFLFDVLELVLF